MQPIIEVINGVPRHPSYRMKAPVNFVMNPGEQIALIGPNGAGKSRLVDILIGRWPLLMNEVKYHFPSSVSDMVCDNIKYLTFRDSYGDADGTFYYQQRWNSQDMETTPLVRELLPETSNETLRKTLFDLFGLEEFLDKHIVLLSSGELRKFQLTKALISSPSVLILDNPFIGLDTPTRDLLRDLLEKMIQVMHLHVILVLSREDEIPDFITHIVPVEDLVCGEKIEKYVVLNNGSLFSDITLNNSFERSVAPMDNICSEDEIVHLNKVSIRYGDRTILNELDWTVRKGEKWALTGENGSGKSTLLSLIVRTIHKVMHAIFPSSDANEVQERAFGKSRST